MRALAKPAISSKTAFVECTSRARGTARERYQSVGVEVETASQRYESSALADELDQLKPSDFCSTILPDKQLEAVYDNRMARSDAPGRWIYDEIRLSADICPLCGQRKTANLDHYLPKSKYPLLSVDPLNLVPVCMDCNFAKLDAIAVGPNSVPINPYFHDLGNDIWLRATLIEDAPCGAIFNVVSPETWTAVLAARVTHQFQVLKLGALYTSHAGVELRQIGEAVKRAHARRGEDGVREHLQDQADSRRLTDPNTWPAALYSALHASDWYCRGGFLGS